MTRTRTQVNELSKQVADLTTRLLALEKFLGISYFTYSPSYFLDDTGLLPESAARGQAVTSTLASLHRMHLPDCAECQQPLTQQLGKHHPGLRPQKAASKPTPKKKD